MFFSGGGDAPTPKVISKPEPTFPCLQELDPLPQLGRTTLAQQRRSATRQSTLYVQRSAPPGVTVDISAEKSCLPKPALKPALRRSVLQGPLRPAQLRKARCWVREFDDGFGSAINYSTGRWVGGCWPPWHCYSHGAPRAGASPFPSRVFGPFPPAGAGSLPAAARTNFSFISRSPSGKRGAAAAPALQPPASATRWRPRPADSPSRAAPLRSRGSASPAPSPAVTPRVRSGMPHAEHFDYGPSSAGFLAESPSRRSCAVETLRVTGAAEAGARSCSRIPDARCLLSALRSFEGAGGIC